jgi:hypothetical protein
MWIATAEPAENRGGPSWGVKGMKDATYSECNTSCEIEMSVLGGEAEEGETKISGENNM